MQAPDTKDISAKADLIVATITDLQTKQANLDGRIAGLETKGIGTAELKAEMVELNGDVAKQIDALKAQLKADAEERAEKETALQARIDTFERQYGGVGGDGAPVTKSPGAQIVAHDVYKDAAEKKRQSMDRVQVKGFLPDLRKDVTGLNDAGGGALRDSLRLPGIVVEPDIMPNVRSLIPTTRTTAGRVDWVRETLLTNNAAAVAESSSASPATKPQSDMTFELVQESMKTIATWIPASRQILTFDNRTQLQTLIDRRLRYALERVLEQQILTGDGTGVNLNGLTTQADTYDRGYDAIQGAAATYIDTLRRAKTQVRLSEYPTTGYVLNPEDWEQIVLTKDAELRYIIAMPGEMTDQRLWGVPVVDSTVMTEGDFLAGAFALGAELFVGPDANIAVGQEHASYFIQNLVAILAEVFALLAVYRPSAFVTGSFTTT